MKRDWVKWIAWGIAHGGIEYAWTIEERQPGLFFCVCYDKDFPEGLAVNEADSALQAKRQAQEEAGTYSLHWVPVNAFCNRHTGACDHLHWDKTDRVCGAPVGFTS